MDVVACAPGVRRGLCLELKSRSRVPHFPAMGHATLLSAAVVLLSHAGLSLAEPAPRSASLLFASASRLEENLVRLRPPSTAPAAVPRVLEAVDAAALAALGDDDSIDSSVVSALRALVRQLKQPATTSDVATAALASLAQLIHGGALSAVPPDELLRAVTSLTEMAARRLNAPPRPAPATAHATAQAASAAGADGAERVAALRLLSSLAGWALADGTPTGAEAEARMASVSTVLRACADAHGRAYLPPAHHPSAFPPSWRDLIFEEAEGILLRVQAAAIATPDEPSSAPGASTLRGVWSAALEGYLGSSPVVAPHAPLLGLRLLRALLATLSDADADAEALVHLLSSRLLPAALQACRAGGPAASRLAFDCSTALALGPTAAGLALQRGMLLLHGPLAALAAPGGEYSGEHAAAVRCLAAVLARPGSALELFLTQDCHPLRADLWSSLLAVLGGPASQPHPASAGVPTHADAAGARLRLSVCSSLLRDLERSPAASDPEAWEATLEACARKRKARQRAAAFNADAPAAVAAWRAEGVLGGDEGGGDEQDEAAGEALGRQLFTTPDLDPRALGGYLSRPEPLARAALASFLGEFDYSGLPLDRALRLAFAALHMPGEAQKVDRVMQAFAAALYRDAPGPFADAKAAYVMAFSTMLLNTDAHNAAVRTKMSADQFVSNNRGINGGADLPREYLEALYVAVVTEEIQAHDLGGGGKAGGGGQHAPPRVPSAARWQYLAQRERSLTQRELSLTRTAAGRPAESVPPPPTLEAQAHLFRSLAPVALGAAAAVLSPPSSAAPIDEAEAAAAADGWSSGVRTVLACVRLSAAHGGLDETMNAAIRLLCDASELDAHLFAPEHTARASSCASRPMCCAAAAVALAEALPSALSSESWRRLIEVSLACARLELTPAPSVSASTPDNDGPREDDKLDSASSAAAATAAAERFFAAPSPRADEPPWLRHRSLQQALDASASPARLLSGVAGLGAEPLAEVLRALLEVIDRAMTATTRQQLPGGGQPPQPPPAAPVAAAALGLLADALVLGEATALVPWAVAEARERFERVLAVGQLPPGLLQAAARARERIREL